MKKETFTGIDALRTERAARDFGKMVDRVGIDEARRIRDERSGAGPDNTRPTLKEWFATYLDKSTGHLRDISDKGRADYVRDADRHILPVLGELPVDSITERDVARWLTWLEDQPSGRYTRKGARISAKTVTNRHGLLSQALTEAAKTGLRDGNPARGATITRGRRQGITFLTVPEYMVLLHFIPDQYKPVIQWLAESGMRWSEATALPWSNLDTQHEPPMVTIDRAWKQLPGGGREIGAPKGVTSNDDGVRRIGMPRRVTDLLGPPQQGDALVFPAKMGGALWSGPFWTRVWGPAVDKANDPAICATAGLTPIGKRPRIHDLRHSHASWLIAAGRPLPYIQRRLGHKDVQTTINLYGHLMPDAMQGDADALDYIMAPLNPVIEPAQTQD